MWPLLRARRDAASAERLLLMLMHSRISWSSSSVPLFFARSEPARSTRLSSSLRVCGVGRRSRRRTPGCRSAAPAHVHAQPAAAAAAAARRVVGVAHLVALGRLAPRLHRPRRRAARCRRRPRRPTRSAAAPSPAGAAAKTVRRDDAWLSWSPRRARVAAREQLLDLRRALDDVFRQPLHEGAVLRRARILSRPRRARPPACRTAPRCRSAGTSRSRGTCVARFLAAAATATPSGQRGTAA